MAKGAIDSLGDLTLTRSVIAHNTATTAGAAFYIGNTIIGRKQGSGSAG